MKSKILLAIILFILAGHALQAAVITSFSPAQGPVGTLVTINGTNLGSPTAFTIGGKTAIVISNTGTQLVALVMPGATTGVISITAGGSTGNSGSSFTITPTSYPAVQQGAALVGTNGVGQPYQGNSVAISADGNTAVVGGYVDNAEQGSGWFYTRSGGTWTQQGAKVTGTGTSGGFGAYFGSSVSISADGNTAIFGGPGDNTGTGATWVFTRSGGVWTQQGAKLVGTGAIANNGNPKGNAQQGQSVSLSADGNTMLVGGWFDNGGIGATWVFTRSGTTWSQQGAKLLGSNGVGNAYQGHAVAISADGNTALIGGYNDNSGQGATWVFTRSGGVWTQQGLKIVGTGNTGAAQQGTSVALSADGNTAIIGGPGDTSPLGAAWVFTRSGGAWTQQGSKLVGTGGFNYSYGSTEGSAVSLSADGNTAIIGGDTDDDDTGAIWVFTRSGGTWTQQGNKLFGSGNGATAGAGQGSSVAISADGTTTIEGAPENNTNYGLAYVFTPTLPTATTETATNITATGVTLYGLFSANGIPANANFEYGTAPDLTGSTITTTFNQGSNPVTTSFDAITSAVTGLTPATTYYWRANATNVNGTAHGAIKNFNTGAAPPPPAVVITFISPGNVAYGSVTVPNITSTDPTTPFNYRFVTPGIATVTPGGDFQAIGVGTSSIVAYQYAPGTTNIEAVAPGSITVIPATLNVQANNQTVAYGQPIPPLTITYTGFVNGETSANLSQQAAAEVSAFQFSQAGSYPINISQAPVDPNYTFTYTPGTLTITPILPVPTAVTDPATGVAATTAILNGTSSGEGANATITFQYTSDDGDGPEDFITVSPTTGPNPVPANTSVNSLSAAITGLTPNTTYYFRIIATNNEFNIVGPILTFVTPAALLTQTITFPQPAAVTYGSADVTPGATSTNNTIPITYTSSNTAVATITAGGNIHILSAGTTMITASQAGNTTYNAATPVTQTFTVNPAPLTITANSLNKVEGQPNPLLTINYSGFVDGESQANLTTLPTVTTTATTASGIGDYPITVSGAVDPNYNITYVDGTLSVTAVPLLPQTITFAQPAAVIYGSADVAPGATSTNNTIPITYTSSNTAVATITAGGNIHVIGAGTTVITASQAGNSTYSPATPVNQNFVVNPATLTITASTQSRLYGQPNPAFTVTYSGFVNGDTQNNLTAPATATAAAGTLSPVGSYPATASGAIDPNYTFNYVNGTLTITPATLTITANDQNKTYGADNPPLTLSYVGFASGDNAGSLSTPATVSTTATTASAPGGYPITASGAVDANYNISYTNGTLTVTPAPLTITANDQTKIVGSDNPLLTIKYTGFANGDNQGSLTTAPTITTTATTASPIGSYPITVTGAADPNYTITYVNGTLTVTPPLSFGTITAKTYGDPDFDPGATGAGLTYTSSNTGIATIVAGKAHIVGAGSTVITASLDGASIQQTLLINPAPLTITANNQTKIYGTDNPALTVSYSGFVYNDSSAQLIDQPVVTTDAGTPTPVGTYSISVSGASSPNYTISYVAGTFTITPATRSITFNPLASEMYGSPDFDPGATASTGEKIIYSSDNNAVATIVNGEIHITGVGTTTITATVAANSNYSNTPSVSQQLVVTKAPQTISFAAIPNQERKTTYDLSGVTASSGLSVTFALSDQMVASITGTTLYSNELGNEIVTASQAGDDNYLPATDVEQSFSVIDPAGDQVLVSLVVSPNGDGINDVLVIEGIENYPDNDMILINRNGVKIFEMSGYNNVTRVFDGHSSVTGALQQQGTYLYLLKYRVNGQEKRKTGFTELRY